MGLGVAHKPQTLLILLEEAPSSKEDLLHSGLRASKSFPWYLLFNQTCLFIFSSTSWMVAPFHKRGSGTQSGLLKDKNRNEIITYKMCTTQKTIVPVWSAQDSSCECKCDDLCMVGQVNLWRWWFHTNFEKKKSANKTGLWYLKIEFSFY